MRKCDLLCAFVLSCSLFVQGCAPSAPVSQGAPPAVSSTVKASAEKPGPYGILIPEGWKLTNELNAQAIFQAYKEPEYSCVIVINEKKKETTSSFSNYNDAAVKNFTSVLEKDYNVTTTDTMVGKYKAKKNIVSGKIKKIDLKYEVYVIDHNDEYIQLGMWVPAQFYNDKVQSHFDFIKSSIK